MRNRFDEQLARLHEDLIRMGALCEESIALAAKAMQERDPALAAKVAPVEEEINQMERDIENLCLKLLLQQQPVAKDLRKISAALKMITDMERIGDQALNIAEIVISLQGHFVEESSGVAEMAKAAIHMVTESVDAFVRQDVELARSAIAHDDLVDEYFDKTKNSLIQLLAQSPEEGAYALDLLMIAKYFERIGDHATNIAEWVVFSVTGLHKGES